MELRYGPLTFCNVEELNDFIRPTFVQGRAVVFSSYGSFRSSEPDSFPDMSHHNERLFLRYISNTLAISNAIENTALPVAHFTSIIDINDVSCWSYLQGRYYRFRGRAPTHVVMHNNTAILLNIADIGLYINYDEFPRRGVRIADGFKIISI